MLALKHSEAFFLIRHDAFTCIAYVMVPQWPRFRVCPPSRGRIACAHLYLCEALCEDQAGWPVYVAGFDPDRIDFGRLISASKDDLQALKPSLSGFLKGKQPFFLTHAVWCRH